MDNKVPVKNKRICFYCRLEILIHQIFEIHHVNTADFFLHVDCKPTLIHDAIVDWIDREIHTQSIVSLIEKRKSDLIANRLGFTPAYHEFVATKGCDNDQGHHHGIEETCYLTFICRICGQPASYEIHNTKGGESHG